MPEEDKEAQERAEFEKALDEVVGGGGVVSASPTPVTRGVGENPISRAVDPIVRATGFVARV